MKKIIGVLLAAALMLSVLTGCETDPSKALVAAVEKTGALSSVESNIDMTIGLELMGQTAEMPMTGNVKYAKKDGAYVMESKMNMEFMGQSMETTSYYSDGYLYSDVSGSKTKQELPVEDAMKSTVSMMELDADMVKEFTTEKVDGGTKYTLTMDDEKVSGYLEELITQGTADTLDEAGVSDMEYSFSNLQMSYVVDGKGYASQQWVAFDCAVNTETEAGAMDMAMKLDVTVTYVNPGQEVAVSLPADLDSYEEADLASVA